MLEYQSWTLKAFQEKKLHIIRLSKESNIKKCLFDQSFLSCILLEEKTAKLFLHRSCIVINLRWLWAGAPSGHWEASRPHAQRVGDRVWGKIIIILFQGRLFTTFVRSKVSDQHEMSNRELSAWQNNLLKVTLWLEVKLKLGEAWKI